MFSSKSESKKAHNKKPGAKGRSALVNKSVTIITAGCRFEGKLYCCGSSRIGGEVVGEIHSEGMLIIEQGASIEADIVADHVIIQGSVKGKLTATSRVELCANSFFEGDIEANTLVISEGARFNGQSRMLAAGEKSDRARPKSNDSKADQGVTEPTVAL